MTGQFEKLLNNVCLNAQRYTVFPAWQSKEEPHGQNLLLRADIQTKHRFPPGEPVKRYRVYKGLPRFVH